jgi:hypothetical protein
MTQKDRIILECIKLAKIASVLVVLAAFAVLAGE